MEVKYVKKNIAKIIISLFFIIMMLFGAAFALIWFKHIFNYMTCLIVVIVVFIVIIILNKKGQICRNVEIGEQGLVDHLGTLEYREIKKVIYDNNRIEMNYGFANIVTKYHEVLLDKLQEQGVTMIEYNGRLINFERVSLLIIYGLGIYFFYNLFVLIFGIISCLNYNYEIINSLGIVVRVLKLISILLALFVYNRLKNKKATVIIIIVIIVGFIVWGQSVKIKTYHDYYGKFACIMKERELNIYKDIIAEYGILDKTINNLDSYKVADLTNYEKVIVYQGTNISGQYIVHRDVKNNNSKEQIFAYYNGKTFTHGALRITFNDGKLAIIDYNGAVYDYDKLKLVNGYILEIYKDNEVKKCLIFNYFKGYDNDEYRRSWELVISNLNDGKQNLYILKDSDDEKVRPQPNNKSENKIDAQTETDNVVSDEIKVSNGEKLIKKMDSINITAFESNEDFVKIKADSSDYNEIVLEVAKQFTIINNTDKKIDTQILGITIMSGSLEEFGVATNDRQDVEDIGKVKNTYYYRIRKVGNYYLAARVGDDCSVNVGLTMLEPVIATDTSQTTDFLYRIDGKKYLGNRWGDIGG